MLSPPPQCSHLPLPHLDDQDASALIPGAAAPPAAAPPRVAHRPDVCMPAAGAAAAAAQGAVAVAPAGAAAGAGAAAAAEGGRSQSPRQCGSCCGVGAGTIKPLPQTLIPQHPHHPGVRPIQLAARTPRIHPHSTHPSTRRHADVALMWHSVPGTSRLPLRRHASLHPSHPHPPFSPGTKHSVEGGSGRVVGRCGELCTLKALSPKPLKDRV